MYSPSRLRSKAASVIKAPFRYDCKGTSDSNQHFRCAANFQTKATRQMTTFTRRGRPTLFRVRNKVSTIQMDRRVQHRNTVVLTGPVINGRRTPTDESSET